MQSSKSMKFLIENGFDFNTQALKGIPYFPGENKVHILKFFLYEI